MRRTRTALLALVLLLLAAGPFGPLFPWSPWKPGYRTLSLDRADLVIPDGTEPEPAYLAIDRFMREAEDFHQLDMPRRVTVVACRNWNDFARFMPQIRGRGVGAVTLQTGTVIYVSPRVREKDLDPAEFLRHELSHAILHQNQSILNAWRMSKQQWFSEGIAVLFGRQRAYIDAAEFTERARADGLEELFSGGPQSDMRFAYQAWRYLLDWLIQTRGRDRFRTLELRCIAGPNTCRESFAHVYGFTLPQAIAEFQAAVRDVNYVPAD